MIWREKRVLLIALGVLLAANVFFFLTYRIQYQSRLDAIDSRVSQLQEELEQARLARVRSEKQQQSYQKVQRDIAQVLNELWSTQPERFTRLVSEIKRLAEASNLSPQSYSFTRTESEGERTRQQQRLNIGAVDVGIDFSVTGTYQQVRRLINLLELSQQFVIINGIALTAPDENTLTLNLHLKTLFREEQPRNAGSRL